MGWRQVVASLQTHLRHLHQQGKQGSTLKLVWINLNVSGRWDFLAIEKETAQKWDVMQGTTTNMPNTAQQFLELQAMEGAPEEDLNRYFTLLCQKAIIDAEMNLSQSQLKLQQINTATTTTDNTNTTATTNTDNNNHVDNNDDSDSSGLEGVPPFRF